MPHACATSFALSTSHFAKMICADPSCCLASRSKTGDIALHGPHHVAQKSFYQLVSVADEEPRVFTMMRRGVGLSLLLELISDPLSEVD